MLLTRQAQHRQGAGESRERPARRRHRDRISHHQYRQQSDRGISAEQRAEFGIERIKPECGHRVGEHDREHRRVGKRPCRPPPERRVEPERHQDQRRALDRADDAQLDWTVARSNRQCGRDQREYSPALLDRLIVVCVSGTLIAYSLYTISPQTITLHGSTNLVYTVPLVTYALFRYLYLLGSGHVAEDPSGLFIGDRHLQVSALAWLVAVIWILR
jgi:hypothetical protein